MEKRSLVPLLAVTIVSMLAGCRPATDANTPCFLVAASEDGGRKGLTEKDLKESLGGSNHDFISFGSVECDDQICVRDSKFASDAGVGSGKPCPNGDVDCTTMGEICSAEEIVDPTTNSKGHFCSPAAPGYCSHACISGQNCPSQDSNLDDNPSTRLTCRALLLDADTLSAICSGDGGTSECVRTFGGNTSPYFCARGSAPDAGS